MSGSRDYLNPDQVGTLLQTADFERQQKTTMSQRQTTGFSPKDQMHQTRGYDEKTTEETDS